MITKTILCKLVAKETDSLGYTTYVFERSRFTLHDDKYLMCVRFPNWEHRSIGYGEEGYLKYNEVTAGVDVWYDGEKQIPYKYTDIHFIKFISKKENDEEKKYVV